MIKILCDRCGSVIETKKLGYIAYNFREGLNGDLTEDNEFEHCHYCHDCMKAIRAFLNGDERLAPTEQLQVEPEVHDVQKPEKKQKGRKRVDIGKIMALKDAGWSVNKIADEMNMQPQSVSNAICRYKKKSGEAGSVEKKG